MFVQEKNKKDLALVELKTGNKEQVFTQLNAPDMENVQLEK
jgi:hypothetical protein